MIISTFFFSLSLTSFLITITLYAITLSFGKKNIKFIDPFNEHET